MLLWLGMRGTIPHSGAGVAQYSDDYGLDDRGSIPDRGKKGYFFSPPRLDGFWGPSSFLARGYRGSFPGVKRPGREAGHLVPKLRMRGVIPLLPHYVFKQRDNFTFP
jgi:hypothetical protein